MCWSGQKVATVPVCLRLEDEGLTHVCGHVVGTCSHLLLKDRRVIYVWKDIRNTDSLKCFSSHIMRSSISITKPNPSVTWKLLASHCWFHDLLLLTFRSRSGKNFQLVKHWLSGTVADSEDNPNTSVFDELVMRAKNQLQTFKAKILDQVLLTASHYRTTLIFLHLLWIAL